MTTHTELAAHGGNTGPSLPLLARLYTQGRYTRASVDTGHFGQPLTSLSNAAEWRQIAILRWQMIEDLTRERDALAAALESTERLAGGGEWCALTDEDRERAMRSMPDMLDGFLKSWGWLHFAKAIEAICREKNPTPPPQAERVPLSDEQVEAILREFDPSTRRLPPGIAKLARAIERAHGITPKEGT